jgi:hypothetical protein
MLCFAASLPPNLMNRHQLLTTAAVTFLIGGGAFLAGRASVSRAISGEHSLPVASARAGGVSNLVAADRDRSEAAADRANRPAAKEGQLARLEEIIRGNDPMERNRALLAFLDQLAPGDMPDVVDRFRALGLTDARAGEYAMLLTAWAKADPLAAMAYAEEKTRGPFATRTLLAAWAANDPDAALRWADAHHQGDDANPYLTGIIQGIAATDPERATKLLAGMPFSEERGEALNALLPFIAAKGGDAARAWVDSIQDEQLRDGAIARLAEQLAAKEPKATADWLLANPGQASLRQLDDVIASWMDQDKTAAMSYYDTLPAGEARTGALRGIVNTMALENPREAARFMDSHPADTNDQVIQQFVWHSSQEDPVLAADYIARISNPREQENLYNRMLTGWLRRDPAAATGWIQSNPLPEAVQQRLQRTIQQTQQPK